MSVSFIRVVRVRLNSNFDTIYRKHLILCHFSDIIESVKF